MNFNILWSLPLNLNKNVLENISYISKSHWSYILKLNSEEIIYKMLTLWIDTANYNIIFWSFRTDFRFEIYIKWKVAECLGKLVEVSSHDFWDVDSCRYVEGMRIFTRFAKTLVSIKIPEFAILDLSLNSS